MDVDYSKVDDIRTYETSKLEDSPTCKQSLVDKNTCDLIKEGDFANVWVRFTDMIPIESKRGDTRYISEENENYVVYTPTDTVRVYSMVNGHTCKSLIKETFVGKRRVYNLSKLIKIKSDTDTYIIVLDEIDSFFPEHYYFKVHKRDKNIWLHTNLTSSSDNNYKVITYKTSKSCGKPLTFIKRRSFSGNVSNTTPDTFLSQLSTSSEVKGEGKKRKSSRRKKQARVRRRSTKK